MFKLNPIATNCNFSSDSFYSSSFDFSPLSYTALYNTQPRQRKDFNSRSLPKNLDTQPENLSFDRHINREFIQGRGIAPDLFKAANSFAAGNPFAIIQDSGIYERNRSLNRHVLRQRERVPRSKAVRHKSDQIIAIDTRQNEAVAIGQDKPEYAPSNRKYADRIKRETLTDGSLRAFLSEIAVCAWCAIAHRYNLKKPLQTEARTLRATKYSTQPTGYQERSFWQWIEPPQDIAIDRSANGGFPAKLFAAERFTSIAFIQDSDIYERNLALHCKILTQGSSYRSSRSATRATRQNENVSIGRTKAQNPRFNPQKKGSLQKPEMLAERSLRAFFAAFAVRKWGAIGHRYTLKKATQVDPRSLQITIKPLQTETRSSLATIDRRRSFWQWIEPPPDLPIVLTESAAFLKQGGAS